MPAPAPTCERCGQVHPRGCVGHVEECTACKSGEGNRVGAPCCACGGEVVARACRRAPRKGATVCPSHGGNAPQVKKAAAVRSDAVVLAGSIAELVHLHRPDLDQVDPTTALLEVVADTWAMRRALWGLVGELKATGANAYQLEGDASTPDGRLVLEWVPADPSSLWGPDHKGDAKPHVLVGMLHAATEEHLKACKYAVDAGIEERRVRLAEGTAEAIAGVLRAMAAGVLGVLERLGGDQVLVRAVEGELPGVMRAALEGARVIDVNEGTS